MKEIKIYTDGSSKGNPGKSRIGIQITDSDDNKLLEYSKYLGDNITNNQAEYEAVIHTIPLIKKLYSKIKFDKIIYITDSKLVVEQLSGRWKVKHSHMKELIQTFKREWYKELNELELIYEFKHVLRKYNSEADLLSNNSNEIYLKEYI